jgi:RHS repeat-associated protein
VTSWLPADAQGIGSHASITGALTVGYYSNDLVASQTQGGTTLTFGLDPTQSRFTTSSDGTTTTTSHYADSSDSPAWTSTSATVWSRNVTGPDGGLAATFDQAGNAVLQLANLHGDLVATCTDNTSATGTSSYSESTEFGAPRTAASAPDTYGWLGEKRRSTNDLAGLTLMGVRLYNPTTGRFLSVDPVPGGTDNPYVYVLNPTDSFDLKGVSVILCVARRDSTAIGCGLEKITHDHEHD